MTGGEWADLGSDPKPFLMAANLALEHLVDADEAIRYAGLALDKAANGYLHYTPRHQRIKLLVTGGWPGGRSFFLDWAGA